MNELYKQLSLQMTPRHVVNNGKVRGTRHTCTLKRTYLNNVVMQNPEANKLTTLIMTVIKFKFKVCR